ncbi:MAG: RNA methyltransferase [Salibacteraceae bacterium]
MEGREELDMALTMNIVPKSVVFCPSYVSVDEVLQRYGEEIEILSVSKSLFDALAYQKVPGNYMAIFASWTHNLEKMKPGGTTVILEGIEKPGNLGAIIRTCEAAGVENILVTEADIDLFNPNVIRNSRGSFFNVNTAFCSNDEAMNWVKKHGISIYATSIAENSVDFRSIADSDRKAFVFGPESSGLSDYWLKGSTVVTIPMHGSVDSLNLSVSVGIVLFQ